MKPNFLYERTLWQDGYSFVVGVDEVGRGALAGPVVAGAVVLPQNEKLQMIGIDDSKRLTAKRREELVIIIKKRAIVWAIGQVENQVIDRIGIVKATSQAIRKSISPILNNYVNKRQSLQRLSFMLIDGFVVKYVRGIGLKNQKSIIKGDQKSISIAAASIIAKVYRDALMVQLGQKHPYYYWQKNKGYGTKAHKMAIKKYGLTRYHRSSFVSRKV